MTKILLLLVLTCVIIPVNAQNSTDSFDMSGLRELLENDSILRSFNYKTGRVIIGNNLATIDVPPGFLYLGPEESKYMMEQIFGNPPSQMSLGMLFSDTPSIIEPFKWVIDYNYNADGHVMDDDAKDINYDDLLKQMQEETDLASKERVKKGYESVQLIGWAQKPFYDEQNKKLHWAKELKFGASETHTLNYNVRILGRQGYLEMNIISDINGLTEVKNDIQTILNSTNFVEGQRYADYNEDTDKLAEYGIGGLILGGVLAKTGLLTKIGAFLIKFIKPLIVGLIALAGYLGKRFINKKREASTE